MAHCPPGNSVAVALLSLALCLLAAPAHGYMYMHRGLSRPVIIGNRVFFSQSDGSLTVLDVATGNVVARRDIDATYSVSAAGGLVLAAGDAVLTALDPETLQTVYRVPVGGRGTIHGDVVLMEVATGVAAFHLSDGRPVWRFEREGYLRSIASSGRVLFFRESTPDEGLPLWLVDAETGRVDLDLRLPHTGWPQHVYFDGTHIYVCEDASAGPYGSGYGWGQAPPAPPDDQTTPMLVRVLGLDGGEVNRMPATLEAGVWIAEGKVFDRHGVRTLSEPPPLPFVEHLGSVSVHRFARVQVTIRTFRAAHDTIQTIEVELDDGRRWLNYVPHLTGGWWVCGVEVTGDRLLFTTDRGQAECLDLATGESRWLYVSDTFRGTASYSTPRGMPPRLATLAAQHAADNAAPDKAQPSRPLPVGTDPTAAALILKLAGSAPAPASRVVFDPLPQDPFAEYRGVIWVTRGLALLWVVGPLAVVGVLRRGRVGDAGLAPLLAVLAAPPLVTLYFCGRVSTGATWTLKAVAIGLSLAAIVLAYRAARRGRWLSAAVTVAAVAAASWRGVDLIRWA